MYSITLLTKTQVLLCFLQLVSTQNTDNFMIENVQVCKDVPDPPIKFFLTPKDFTPGFQTVDVNISSPKPIGENAQLKCISFKEVHRHWLYLYTYVEDFCYVFRAYVGQLFYDLERSAAIMPGTCPIPRGTYHAVNSTINFRTFKMQAFPFGKMKFRLETYDKTTKLLNSCVIVIVQNNQ